MARARNIKPGFFRNEILAELPPLTRLLFAGLWTIADKAGRLEDRPKRIKADVLPYDNGDVDAMLNQLSDAGFIARYGTGDTRYIEVSNFGKHQNPHVKEQESTIPVPPVPGEHPASTVQESDRSGASFPLTDSPISDSPISDSPISDSGLLGNNSADAPEGTFDDPKAERGLSQVQSQRFQRWYATYPRKVGRLDAVRAWGKITPAPTDELTERMIAKVQEWADSEEWSEPRFIPHPTTWLNDGRWDDGAPSEKPRNVTHLQARAPNGTRTDAERRREELRHWAYGDEAADPTEDVIDVKGAYR